MASGGGVSAFKSFTMHQNVIDGTHPLLTTTPTVIMKIFSVLYKGSDILEVFNHARPLGISGGYDKKDGKLVYLAIADDKCCRVVRFVYSEGPGVGRGSQRPSLREKPPPPEILVCLKALEDNILRRPCGSIYGFDMGPLSMALFDDLDLRIQNAVDIQSAFPGAGGDPLAALKAALGGEATSVVPVKISKTNAQSLFSTYSYDTSARGTLADNDYTDVAMRAWIAQFLANFENGEAAFTDVPPIDTYNMSVPVSYLFKSRVSVTSST